MTAFKHIDGMVMFKNKMVKAPLLVQFTSDDIGETLSITHERSGLMFLAAFESIAPIIEAERKAGYTNGHFIVNLDEEEGNNEQEDRGTD